MLRVFTSDRYVVPLPVKHPFPIRKYALLRQALVAEKIVHPHQLCEPDPATIEQLNLAHDSAYITSVMEGALSPTEIRRLGFPWSVQLVERARYSVGGTLAAARAALRDGVSGNLAGGTHHAHRDFGSGYCTFNDVAVAVRVLQKARLIHRALIVDLDVHQGDGTANLFRRDDRVFTFSMHGKKNFPFRKANSDLDVPLTDDTSDQTYLELLAQHLPHVFERPRPEIVFYLAGIDPLINDRLGRLNLSLSGLKTRDEMVIGACFQRNVPLVLVLSGGYAIPLEDTVRGHCNTYRVLQQCLNASSL